MDVFSELFKDDVGLMSFAVLAGTVVILGFYIVYFLAKAGKK